MGTSLDSSLNFKVCCTCKTEKSVLDFYKSKQTKDGLYARCKRCHTAATSSWKKRNQPKVRAAHKARYAIKRDEILAKSREWEIKNKDRKNAKRNARLRVNGVGAAKTREWRAKNPELAKQVSRDSYWNNHAKNLQKLKRYRDSNPELFRHHGSLRRAAKLQATPAWANHFFIGEAYHLAQLRKKVCGGIWHVDHIVPLQSKLVCGLHVENNLRVIPGIENMRKSNRHWPDMP